VALIKAIDSTFTVSQIDAFIKNSAMDLVGNSQEDTPGWDRYHGFGVVNAYKALLMASAKDTVSCGQAITSSSMQMDSTGLYLDSALTPAGCDSLFYVNFTNNNSFSSITQSACWSYSSPSGKHTWAKNGVYSDTISNHLQCDSIITINLTINSTVDSVKIESCTSQASPSGKYNWQHDGWYKDTLVNSANCDSALVVDFKIIKVDTSVNQNQDVLMAGAQNATFQWLDCDKNYSPITGETSASFYFDPVSRAAVQVTSNGCVDTSACFFYEISTGIISQSPNSNNVRVFPNPNSGKFIVSLANNEISKFEITGISGNLILKGEFVNSKEINLSRLFESQILILRVYSENQVFRRLIVVN
jgi:hypothetical protein